MIKKLVYLAAPYTHDNPKVVEERVRKINKYAAKLINKGLAVYSPISQCHEIAKVAQLPTTWEFWEQHDRTFLAYCSHIVVLRLPGYNLSIGVRAEIKLAEELGVKVRYTDYDLD